MNARSLIDYFKKDFRCDLLSGVVVGLIALPLAIAFAIASGASAEQGLYTAIIAGLVMGTLSGSRYQVSGPTGAFIVILLGIVNEFGIEGLMMAGFMAGIILLLMGLFHFGSVIKYIPYPVTVGFTAGIGVIIFSGQIKDFLGLTFASRPNGFVETIEHIGASISQGINISSIIIGVITLAVFIVWKKFSKNIPPAPIALLAGISSSIVITKFFSGSLPLPVFVSAIPASLPEFHMLNFSWEKIQQLVPAAFTIAMLGAIESLLSAVVADSMTGTKHSSNRELVSQGIGNIIIPFFGGIPATGAIARTAANIRNGARTQVSSIVHSLTLLLILLVAAPLASHIPMAALAAILMMVAYNMAEIPHFIHILKAPKEDAMVLLATFFLTVFVDLTVAVGVGIVLAAILFIKMVSQLSLQKIFEDPEGIKSAGTKRLHASIRRYPQIILYELAGPLFFGVASELESRIEHSPGQILILRMKHVYHMDASVFNILEIIVERALQNKGHIYLSTLHPAIKIKLKKLGIIDKIGGEYYAPSSTTIAIERAKKQIKAASGKE